MRTPDAEELEFRSAFGNRLKSVCEKRSMTRREVAKDAKLAASCVYDYSEGSKRAGLYESVRIAKALKVSLDWLAGYKPPQRKCVYDRMSNRYVCTRCKFETNGEVRKFRYCPGCGAAIAYKTGLEEAE